MSSILEALRELEGGDGPTTSEAEPWTDGPGPLRRAVPALALAGCAALAAGGAFFWSRSATVTAPAPAPAPAAAPAAQALPPAAPASAPPLAALDADPPRARLTAAKPAAVAPALPSVVKVARVTADVPRLRATLPRPSDEPLVQIGSIGYVANAEQRVVSLRVNGGQLATLHEGESVDGVEVQLIMPASVYVRHGGQIFSVDAGG